MERSIFKFILRYSLRDQILLILLTGLSMPFVYFALEVPKIIINEAIGGQNLPDSILGVEVDQIAYLWFLCGVFLFLVVLNGGFKYVLNIYRGVLGERMLRRLRYELYNRVLRFPLPHFKRVSQGEIIPMITAETEPLGGFIGEAFALPAFQGGILLTYLTFIFNQDVLLGAVAVAFYPLQMYFIPKLQRRVNTLAKRRVLTVRKLADRIGDSVLGVTEIHANDTSRYERADISDRLGTIYAIRYKIFRLKFFIKFINNFLAQVTPFFFYSAGGYFVIKGELSLGALIAALAAFKDLASPWNELLKYYQTKEDVRVKYNQIAEQFRPANMLEAALQDAEPEGVEPMRGRLVATNLSFSEDGNAQLLDGANFSFALETHVATLGATGSGKGELARLLARLLMPSTGRIEIGGTNMAHLPEAVVGRRIAYVGPSAHLFSGTVRDNLFYGLKHLPLEPINYDEHQTKEQRRKAKASEAAGNSQLDINADWIDYGAAGVSDPTELDWKSIDILELVGMGEDAYQLGLKSAIDPLAKTDLAEGILNARKQLLRRLADSNDTDLIEPFDQTRYNHNATVAENLLFGTPSDPSFEVDQLVNHPHVRQVLDQLALTAELTQVGREVAETMVELFADLPPGHEFFEQFSFISAEDLPEFQVLLNRISGRGMASVDAEGEARLLSLAFRLTPSRHRLGLIDERLEGLLLEARSAFLKDLPQDLQDAVEFFDADQYNAALNLQDNILFGKRAYGQAHGQAQLMTLIGEVIDALDLRRDVLRVALDYEVGIAGGRLSVEQRQKIALARGLLKNPDLLIVDEATGIMDTAAERRAIQAVRDYLGERGLVWVLSRAELAQHFDHILVMDNGKVVEQGSYEELQENGIIFNNLLATG